MKRENIIRGILGTIYITGGIINLIVTLSNVEIYRAWKDSALLGFYKWFITNVPNNQLTVIIILVALFELSIGLSLLFNNFLGKFGILFAMLFHLIILPWGLWSLPNLLFLIPLSYLYKNDFSKPDIKLSK